MAWAVAAKSDKEVSDGTSGKLCLSDLEKLCDERGWLTDSLMDWAVTKCDIGELGAWGELYAGVFWIDPAIVAAGKDGNDEAFKNTLGGAGALGGARAPMDDAVKVRVLPKDASVILFPVNRDNQHWSLLAFYKDTRTFVHYDSLKESNDAAATKLIKRLFQNKYLSKELTFTKAPVTQQEDGYNCGVFVVQTALLHMDAAGKPADEDVTAVTSDTCDAFRQTLLQSLGVLVANAPAQSMIEPSGAPKDEKVQAEKRARLLEQIAKVDAQLAKEEEGPISLAGMTPCPLMEAAIIRVALFAGGTGKDFESAAVLFKVGKETFARKAIKNKDTGQWVVSEQFRADKAFDVEIEAVIKPAAAFDGETTATQKSIRAKETRNVNMNFTPKPPRKVWAKFLVEDEGEPRPLPKGMQVRFAFDEGNDGDVVELDEYGNCNAEVPWKFSRVAVTFPANPKWRRVTWKPDAPKGQQATFKDVNPDTEKDMTLVFPPRNWNLERDEWHVPDKQLAKDGTFLRQLDANTPGMLGSEAEPLIYILSAGAVPSKSFRMNGKVIDHVVVLMLENRGFDHFMGWLYEGADKPKNSLPKEPKGPHASLRPFEGLDGIQLTCPYDYTYEQEYNLKVATVKIERNLKGQVSLKKGARAANTPKTNPHEDFIHVLQDMYGKDVVKVPKDMEDAGKRDAAIKNGDNYKTPAMNGWAHNYCDGARHHRGHGTRLTHEMISEIMDMYLPDQLPVMSGLAKNYGVSDVWFCSVPSQTNTNRAFWCTGSAAGLVTNDFYPAHKVLDKLKHIASDRLPEGPSDDMEKYRRSLFDVLEQEGVSWKYYYTLYWPPKIGGIWPKDLCKQFEDKKFTDQFPLIKNFYADVQGDKLPAVSYLEPLWGGGAYWETSDPTTRYAGNEFHPVSDTTYGEFFVKEVYDSLFGDKPGQPGTPNNPKRDSTVLMITFDENGGTFDHLPPWKAQPTGREPPKTQFDFKFDSYGIRVPTLLISKYVKPGTVFRSPTEVPFDHASVLSTILKWRGIPQWKWKLGKRVENAPTWDYVLDGTDKEAPPDRFKKGAGMAGFDKERAKIATNENVVKYGDVFSLRYTGDRWPYDPSMVGEKKPLKKQNAKIGDKLTVPEWLGGPHQDKMYWYPIGERDPGKALKFKFTGGKVGDPVKTGSPYVIEVVDGKAQGYTLGVPEVMGASAAFLYKGSNDSKWIPWIWNDRTEGQNIYFGDDVFFHSERYQPERLTLYYDPYQRLSFDPYSADAPTVKRWARFRAGEWDMWKIEKPQVKSKEVKGVLTSDRTRPVLEGGKPYPVPIDMSLKFDLPELPNTLTYMLLRSREQVEVFSDELCTKPLAFTGNVATIQGAMKNSLVAGEVVKLWARSKDDQAYFFRFGPAKSGGTKSDATLGRPSHLEIRRAFSFLEGTSKWLQLVDSFETVAEILGSLNRIRSVAALADMGADEFVNFAVKRLFIRKGVLEQPVVIRIDDTPTELKHPLTGGQLPLRYSDFIVDRSGPKFLGALDADVAVEALMYKDACISTKIAELKKQIGKDGQKLASSFDPDVIQSVRDMAQRRWERLLSEQPANYPDLSDSEIEAATSIFEQKHMAQRKLSDFDLTARETETLSMAIKAALHAKCGEVPDVLAREIGRIAWSKGGPIDTGKVKAAMSAPGDLPAKAKAYAASCTGPAYEPKKEYAHGHYKGTGYYHILIDEVGVIACRMLEDSMPDVDAGYGLGIPYMGPQYVEEDGKLVREKNPKPEEHDRFEIGDIITDETSHYGTVFSHNLNIQSSLQKLKDAGVDWSYAKFDKAKNLRDNARELIRDSGKADIAKAYFEREALIDTVLMFEQVSKKEAQAQFFKVKNNTSKLMGNVSDVSQFLYGVDIASRVAKADGDDARQKRMEALKEIVMLSCLVAFPRWSVFAKNVDNARDTAGIIKPSEFADSINERSYSHKKVARGSIDPESPRVNVEWQSIDNAIASQRLKDFATEMTPIWDFIKAQKKHFQNMDELLKTVKAKTERGPSLKAVRDELKNILPKLANLSVQVKGQEEALLDALTLQCEESAIFQDTRAPKELP